jgi:hypothetical protein
LFNVAHIVVLANKMLLRKSGCPSGDIAYQYPECRRDERLEILRHLFVYLGIELQQFKDAVRKTSFVIKTTMVRQFMDVSGCS